MAFRSRWLLGQLSVGDVVLVWSPLNPASRLVRRLAALGGQEMVSAKDNQTFVIRDGQCWFLADNQNLKPEVCIFSSFMTESASYLKLSSFTICLLGDMQSFNLSNPG